MRVDFNRIAMLLCALLMIAMVSTAHAETELVFEAVNNGEQLSLGKDEVILHLSDYDYTYPGQIHLIEISKDASWKRASRF